MMSCKSAEEVFLCGLSWFSNVPLRRWDFCFGCISIPWAACSLTRLITDYMWEREKKKNIIRVSIILHLQTFAAENCTITVLWCTSLSQYKTRYKSFYQYNFVSDNSINSQYRYFFTFHTIMAFSLKYYRNQRITFRCL